MAVCTGSAFLLMRRRGTGVMFLFGLILMSGCAALRPPMLFPPGTESPAQVAAALEHNFARIDHFQGQGRLSVSFPGRSVSVTTRLIIDRPDTLFVRLEALFGLDIGWFFSDRHHYRFYIPMENLYGDGSVDSVQRTHLFKLAPDYDQLLSTLCGLEQAKGLTGVQLVRKEDRLILSGQGPLGEHTYWIDARRGVVLQGQVCDSSGQVLLRQKFDRFKRIGGVQLPQSIRVERPGEKQALVLHYDEIRVNRNYSPREIKTRIPASARKARW